MTTNTKSTEKKQFSSDCDVLKLLQAMRDGMSFPKKTQKQMKKDFSSKNISEADISRFLNSRNDLSSGKKVTIINAVKDIYKNELEQLKNSKLPKEFDIYIYYYFSYEGYVKPALMKIAKDDKQWTTEEGQLVYYKKDENESIVDTPFKLYKTTEELISSKPMVPQVAFFKAINDNNQVNFFTVNVKGVSLEKRKIMFLTYSVVETDDNKPSSGFGILVKVQNEAEAIKKIKNELNSDNIADWILNALCDKKMSFTEFEHSVYKSENEVKELSSQYVYSINVSAYYEGYYLVKESTNDKIQRLILEIKESGQLNIYFSTKENQPHYKGTITFPINHVNYFKVILKSCSYVSLIENKSYIFLHKKENDNLEGIFCRWNNVKTCMFASPIYLKKIVITNMEGLELNLENVLEKFNPNEIKKDDLNSDENLKNELLKEFEMLFNKYFSSIDSILK